MRGAIIFALMLAGCSREPSFDQRYAAVEQRLKAKAAKIDRELEDRDLRQAPGQPAPSRPEPGRRED